MGFWIPGYCQPHDNLYVYPRIIVGTGLSIRQETRYIACFAGPLFSRTILLHANRLEIGEDYISNARCCYGGAVIQGWSRKKIGIYTVSCDINI